MSDTDDQSKERRPILKLVIDKQEFEWPEQYITAEQIRQLGNIPPDAEVFLKISPPWSDEPVLPATKVDLARPGIEHFFTREKFLLVVNGREKPWYEKEIGFEQLVGLAFGNSANNPNTHFTVSYSSGPPKNPSGTMVKGQKVWVKTKMVFNVTGTDKS
jgi:hypothetical protein